MGTEPTGPRVTTCLVPQLQDLVYEPIEDMKIKIKKGLDLKLDGAVTPGAHHAVHPSRVAVYPGDFEGFVPKVDVKDGDTVAAGSALLHDKNNPDIKLVSPVSGRVAAVERGERRRIIRVIVEADGTDNAHTLDTASMATRHGAYLAMAHSGLLAMVRQRPYDIVPCLKGFTSPRDIFVTLFDSAPLAVSPGWDGDGARVLEAGVRMLRTLTDGNVYISRRPGQSPDIAGATMVDVTGPHPAGNAGVQAANIDPVNKGQVIWTLSGQTLYRIGILALEGRTDTGAAVAVCGWALPATAMVDTVAGCPVSDLLKAVGARPQPHTRYISGNVLTGVRVDGTDGYLRYPYTQLTVMPEGDDVDEFMGWASLSPGKMSLSPSFPGWLLGGPKRPDARVCGGRRAMIMSGLYERYLPMDIMAEYLLKAINSNDIDNMERLGIYEIAPEDMALAEFADSSKQPLQSIVRQGLDYIHKELE